MNPIHIKKVSQELKLSLNQVEQTANLIGSGSTVPFIARYRKEMTGSLDEVAITKIRDRLIQLHELDERRKSVLDTISKLGKLSDELKEKIIAAETMSVLEDLYLPYKPKRRTRAIVAKEKGLEPLAEIILKQIDAVNPEHEAVAFVSVDKKVESTAEALAGARDIIAEWIAEDIKAREQIRALFLETGKFQTKVIPGKEQEGINFKDYFDWSETVKTAASHRVLAMRRGEKEAVLLLRVIVDEAAALEILRKLYLKGNNPSSQQVKLAIEDGYKRLLSLSIENEVRMISKQKADEDAIVVFTQNLRQLLMAAPLGLKNVLAIDPGFRTGCKVVCLDRHGKLLKNDTVFIAESEAKIADAQQTILKLVKLFDVEFIAIGNGTASRETESFIRKIPFPKKIDVVMVNESGASIYSASDVAREEFPTHDVTVRGAVSIGRRLQDPLAELVKLDPKSIGVGQYQHDVDQNKLKNSLDDIVISCVNQVGVEVNSASKQLLMYVSGMGPALAQAFVDYRNEHGAFKSRSEFLSVPKMGPKAFEQAAGFLRIRNAENPLDTSAVHPESYETVERIARDLKCNLTDLMQNENYRRRVNLQSYVTPMTGLPTLTDIMEELAKPGRDPRKQFEVVQFKEGVEKIEDLKIGMKLNGVVTNVTNFGAFVDIGVHHDGLVHVSELADKYVKHPSEVVAVQQKVTVTVVEIDLERKRIALTMRKKPR